MSTMTLHTSAIDRLCKRNVELSAFSTYGIGGSANYLAMPETANDLADLLQDCRKRGMPWYIFGMGSNILFPDEPKHDLVFISLKTWWSCGCRAINGTFHPARRCRCCP